MTDYEIAEAEGRRLEELLEKRRGGSPLKIVQAWYEEVCKNNQGNRAVADSAYRRMKSYENVMESEHNGIASRLFWTAVGFAGVMTLFLMYAALQKGLDAQQMKIIRFLCSSCGGASAAFMSGSAIIKADYRSPLMNIALSGTCGIAIFFTVFMLFNLI